MKRMDGFEVYIRTELGLSEATLSAYVRDVKQFLNFIGSQELSAKLIEAFISQLKLKSTTQRRKYMSIRCFCNHLISNGNLNSNILRTIDSVRVNRSKPDALDSKTVDALISAIKNRTPISRTANVRRDIAIVLILYHSGLRVSELCDLNIDDIKFARREIKVRGKGGRDRMVPTTQKCIEAIQDYLDNNRQSTIGVIFVKTDGHRITRRTVSNMLTSLSRRAGVKHTTSHALRRTCATRLMENGMDLVLIQKLLGHQNLSTTQDYLAIDDDRLAHIHSHYHPFGENYEL